MQTQRKSPTQRNGPTSLSCHINAHTEVLSSNQPPTVTQAWLILFLLLGLIRLDFPEDCSPTSCFCKAGSSCWLVGSFAVFILSVLLPFPLFGHGITTPSWIFPNMEDKSKYETVTEGAGGRARAGPAWKNEVVARPGGCFTAGRKMNSLWPD